MIFCGYLKKKTAEKRLIGPVFSYSDGKTPLYNAIGGNDNFDPSLLKCTLSKNVSQQSISLTKDRKANYLVVTGDGMLNDYTGNPLFYGSPNGTYYEDGIVDGQKSYRREDGMWFITYYYNGSSYRLAKSKNPQEQWSYFIKYNPDPVAGTYDPQGFGITGNPIVESIVTGVSGDNDINLVLGGMAEFELTAANTDTDGMLIISLENATAGNELLFVESYFFIVGNPPSNPFARRFGL
jgi:hypothetical protein